MMEFDFTQLPPQDRYRLLTNFVGPRPIALVTTRSEGGHSNAAPMITPRNLDETNPQVIQAMRDALAYLAEQKIAPDTPWGELQVAGDEGAPPIGLGGGDAAAGNANALASRLPASNTGRLRPISYGSSYIQGIAFLDRGKLAARTILTYGQSTDPTSPWSADQTRMFGAEQWVSFPFTAAQIDRQRISRRTVTG
jgi:acyl-homoserine-lactone acylase